MDGSAAQNTVPKLIKLVRKLERGFEAETEYRVVTPAGAKRYRFLDVVALDIQTRDPIEFYQVGRQTKRGLPVSRERQAIADIEEATGIKVQFRVYQ